jgi:hypothetical protein
MMTEHSHVGLYRRSNCVTIVNLVSVLEISSFVAFHYSYLPQIGESIQSIKNEFSGSARAWPSAFNASSLVWYRSNNDEGVASAIKAAHRNIGRNLGAHGRPARTADGYAQRAI